MVLLILYVKGILSIRHLDVASVTIFFFALFSLVERITKSVFAWIGTVCLLAIGAYAVGRLFLPLGGIAILAFYIFLWLGKKVAFNGFRKPTFSELFDLILIMVFAVVIVSRFLLGDLDFVKGFVQGQRVLLDKDELFFSSIASMITGSAVPSTGIDGAPFYRYHNLWPYLLACIARMVPYAEFEVYRFVAPLVLIPVLVNSLCLFLRAIKAPKGTLGIFLLFVLAVPLIADPLFRSWDMWLRSSGLTLSLALLTVYLCNQLKKFNAPSSIILALLAGYAKISTGVVLFAANVVFILRSDNKASYKLLWIVINCVGGGVVGFMTLGYWGKGEFDQAYLDYMVPRIDLGYFYFSQFRDQSRIIFFMGVLLIGPCLLLLSKSILGKRVKNDGWSVVWLVSGIGAVGGSGMATLTYETASIYGAIATGVWPALLLSSVYIVEIIRGAGVSGGAILKEIVEPKRILESKIVFLLLLVGAVGSPLVFQIKDRIWEINYFEKEDIAVGKNIYLERYADALLQIKSEEVQGMWQVYIPQDERDFWSAIDDVEFNCLYLPFVVPILSGLPAVQGYNPECGEDSIGIPLKGYTSYGYSAYTGKSARVELCDESMEGYFLLTKDGEIIRTRKVACPS